MTKTVTKMNELQTALPPAPSTNLTAIRSFEPDRDCNVMIIKGPALKRTAVNC